MKTRERLKKLKGAKSWKEKMRLASDDFPGTDFDGLFRDMAEAWTHTHRNDPAKLQKARCPMAKSWSKIDNRKLDAETIREGDNWARAFYEGIGGCLADACVRGESEFLRELADALDVWKRHTPNPDKLRQLVYVQSHPLMRKHISMKRLREILENNGIPYDDSTRSYIQKQIAPECDLVIKGKPGRPTNRKP